ncbi:hypothetical protein Tco_0316954 [Tanacetum coccineum]
MAEPNSPIWAVKPRWWRCGEGFGGGDVGDSSGVVARLWGSSVVSWWRWQRDEDDEGGVMVAAVGRQPEEVEARGGEWYSGSVYKATTEKLDWINPEGCQYPHDLRKPLSLVPNSQGRHVILFHHFINNDIEYLRGGESSRKYSTLVTKTKAADYGHIKWIEGLVHNSNVVKRGQFYAFTATRESARDVYSKRRIIAVTKVEIVEWQNYKHLDWITVRRDDDILYKFKQECSQEVLSSKGVVEPFNWVLKAIKETHLTKLTTYRLQFEKKRRLRHLTSIPERIHLMRTRPRRTGLMRLMNTHVSDGTLDDCSDCLQLKKIKEKEDHAELGRHCWWERPFRERFNTTAGNPVKKILLKLNLSDHRSILTDLKVTPTKPGRMTKPYSSPRFIANYFYASYLKMVVEVPDSS